MPKQQIFRFNLWPKLLIFISVFSLLSCSKSSPYIEKKIEKKILLRSWDEGYSVREIVESKNVENTVKKIKAYHSQDFDWEKFWRKLDSQVLKIRKDYIFPISSLSTISCSNENSSSYMTFLNSFYKVKKPTAYMYLSSINEHLEVCGSYYNLEMHRTFSQNMSTSIKSIPNHLYKNYIDLLFRKGSILKVYDTDKIIDQKMIKRSLKDSFEKKDLNNFLQMIGTLNQVFPNKDFVKGVSSKKIKVGFKDIELFYNKSSFENMMSFLGVVHSSSYIKNTDSFEEILEKIFSKYIKKERDESRFKIEDDLVLEKMIYKTDELVNFAAKAAKSVEQKQIVVKFAEKSIRNILENYNFDNISDYLRRNDFDSYFGKYLKTLYVRDSVENITYKDNFLDQIHFNLINFMNEKDESKKKVHLKKVCDTFSTIGLIEKFKSVDDENQIGCSNIKNTYTPDKEYLLSSYAVYKYHSKGDLVLDVKKIKGGIFDLSYIREKQERKRVDVGRSLDGILIPYFLKTKISHLSDREMIIPYVFSYQNKNNISFSWSEFETPSKGQDGANLMLKIEGDSRPLPVIVSLGGEGDLGMLPPKEGKDASFEIDFERIEMVIPFSFEVLSKDLRTVKNLKVGLKGIGVDKYYSPLESGILPDHQLEVLYKDLTYINDKEGFLCKSTGYECILKNLFSMVIKSFTLDLFQNKKREKEPELFEIKKEELGKIVLDRQEDGERGDNGAIIFN